MPKGKFHAFTLVVFGSDMTYSFGTHTSLLAAIKGRSDNFHDFENALAAQATAKR